jgi:hypothetical protein
MSTQVIAKRFRGIIVHHSVSRANAKNLLQLADSIWGTRMAVDGLTLLYLTAFSDKQLQQLRDQQVKR